MPVFPQKPPALVGPPRLWGQWAWFWEKCVFAVPMLKANEINSASGAEDVRTEEYISRTPSSIQATSADPQWQLGEFGVYLDGFGLGTRRTEWPLTQQVIDAVETMPFVVCLLERGADNANRVILEINANELSVQTDNAVSMQMNVGGGGTAARVGTTDTTVRDGNWHMIIMQALSGDERFYIDGVRSENSNTTDSEASVSAASDVDLFSRNASFGYREHLACVYILNGAITDSQAIELTRDPWGPFRTRPNPFGRALHIIPAAAGVSHDYLAAHAVRIASNRRLRM